MRPLAKIAVITFATASVLAMGACTEVQMHQSGDFGQALHQDLAAQIADPDAKYKGDVAPGSNGARVALAQDRYAKGKVIPPVTASASTVGTQGAGAGATPAPATPQ